ncbi:MAG: NAD(+)/NADH kinase [Candidatus Omnitrophica bacterium]|nr:NAD(+)/NADH kinase [Candidatus Omnitrophota bacterium]
MPNLISRVLVVYKKSAYQLHVLERRDRHLLGRLRRGDPDALDMRQGHQVHRATLVAVVNSLRRLGVKFDLVYRANLKAGQRYRFIVSVGGDGTLLQASHVVLDAPVLGVNSDPGRSEAVFCAARRENFERLCRQALAGSLPGIEVFRLQMTLNGRCVAPLALNDVLITHSDPATMSRYRLRIGRRQEDQKSSGLWVATAAGSSSAVRAAGGLEVNWIERKFLYQPRELYRGRLSQPRLTGGCLRLGQTVELAWLMGAGAAFIDGPHVRHRLMFGDRIRVSLSAEHPLRILGLGQRRTVEIGPGRRADGRRAQRRGAPAISRAGGMAR